MDLAFEPEDGDEAREVFPTVIPLENGGSLCFPFGVDVFARKFKADVVSVDAEGEVFIASQGGEWRHFLDDEDERGSVVSIVRN